jgi:RecA-family ATPase
MRKAAKGVLLAPTALWNKLCAAVAKRRPALVVLDTQADFFGDNEIDRAYLRLFVSMLRGLALRTDCAVLLLSHPSAAGRQSGTGLSGSTAWHNYVRSRLYFDRVSDKAGHDLDIIRI